MKLPKIQKEELIIFIINRFGMTPDEAHDYIIEFPKRAKYHYWNSKVEKIINNALK